MVVAGQWDDRGYGYFTAMAYFGNEHIKSLLAEMKAAEEFASTA